ncbi:MAG: LPXTG cell wall anchor domain-containing protein [Acidimicrobiales bacterium]
MATGTSQAEVPPIRDYATYPPALPAGCVDGESALVNVRFTAGGQTVANLGALPLAPGDTFTMSWDGFNGNCAGVGVGLSSKVATVNVFDATTDYWLRAFSYCGPEAGATPCNNGPNTLTLQVPPAAEVPCYQLDAHLGPPLAQVGPDAAFYGYLNGVRSMLISAQNGGPADCGQLPPCPTNPAIPAAAFDCLSVATTTTAAPTTTQAPVSTLNSQVTTTTAQISTVTTSCAPGQAIDQATGRCTSVQGAQLPATGRSSGSLAAIGGLFALAGLCVAYAYRRSPLAGRG